jgi:hypothetical protein
VSEHYFEDKLEDRDDVVDKDAPEDRKEPDPGEPWAKTSSGNADDVTDS